MLVADPSAPHEEGREGQRKSRNWSQSLIASSPDFVRYNPPFGQFSESSGCCRTKASIGSVYRDSLSAHLIIAQISVFSCRDISPVSRYERACRHMHAALAKSTADCNGKSGDLYVIVKSS